MLNGNGSTDLTNGTYTLPQSARFMGTGTHRQPVGGYVEATNDPDTWRNGLLTVECVACERDQRLCRTCLDEINEEVAEATRLG